MHKIWVFLLSTVLLGVCGALQIQSGHITNLGKKDAKRAYKITREFFPDDYDEIDSFDTGFVKWMVYFPKIEGSPPYTYLKRRLAAKSSNVFYPDPINNSSMLEESKKENKGGMLCVSEKGFMPGEKVTIRLQSKEKEIYSDVTWFPRPLTIFKANGEKLLEAELVNVEATMYKLHITGIGANEKYDFISKSGTETMNNTVTGPLETIYMPGVIGHEGGISHIELRLKEGVYKLDLPWGSELVKYLKGAK